MYKFLAIILALFLNEALFAQQNCDCPEYEGLTKKNQNKRLIANVLMQSKNNICKAKGFEIFGDVLTDETTLDSAEIILQKAVNIYKKTDCGD